MPAKNKKILLLLVFVILGFAFAQQFRSNLKQNIQKSSSVYKIEELQKQLEEAKKINEKLQEEMRKNEKLKDDFLKSAVDSKNDDYLSKKLKELDAVKLKAGLIDVKGSGLTIKMDDAAVRLNENPNVLIIHDSDILKVINELKKAGAQAISVNGERIMATSEQVCAGPTIRINKNRHAAPFIINAIGDPGLMYESVSKSEAVAMMIRDKIRVEISKSGEIVIPKYNDSGNLFKGLEVVEK